MSENGKKGDAVILCDIGGTHIRLCLMNEEGYLDQFEKYPIDAFSSFQEAISAFSEAHDCQNVKTLAIATAAWPIVNEETGEEEWRFAREGHWSIFPAALETEGYNIRCLENDFKASSYGALCLGYQDKITLIEPDAKPYNNRCVILGPGTGLGLAYAEKKDQTIYLQETFGGHMVCMRQTDEHHMILKLVERFKTGHNRRNTLIPEDVVSGPGLLLLYKSIALQHGYTVPDYITPHDLFDPDHAGLGAHHKDIFSITLRVFHEFLGLFTHQAIIYGHAFGGVYLDGGVIHFLNDRKLFDLDSFAAFLIGEKVDTVAQALNTVPVYMVQDPYIALRGLHYILTH